MRIERISTGIRGLDEMIEGGIPKGSSLLIAGGSGTGKTILALQLLYNMAQQGMKVLYVTFEQKSDALVQQMKTLDLDPDELMQKRRFNIYVVEGDYNVEEVYRVVVKKIKEGGVEALVLDSLTSGLVGLGRTYPGGMDPNSRTSLLPIGVEIDQRLLGAIIKKIQNIKDITTIFVDEADANGKNITKNGIAEFLCDGIIALSLDETVDLRGLTIKKMRSTQHPIKTRPIKIGPGGVCFS